MKRPTSLTIVGCFLLAANVILLGVRFFSLDYVTVRVMVEEYPVPVLTLLALGVDVQFATAAAAFGILKGKLWARNTYVGISVLNILVWLIRTPTNSMAENMGAILGAAVSLIFSFLLFRAPSTSYLHRTTK